MLSHDCKLQRNKFVNDKIKNENFYSIIFKIQTLFLITTVISSTHAHSKNTDKKGTHEGMLFTTKIWVSSLFQE